MIEVLFAGAVWAQEPAPVEEELPPEVAAAIAFEEGLDKQTGTVDLGSGLAELDTGERYVYLPPDDTSRLLEAWGNPPGTVSLGAVLPREMSVWDEDCWLVVVQYEEDGYVDDSDADSIDYDELLGEMQAQAAADSEARVEAGYGSVALIGWAEAPHYDGATHKLYWAKELDFGGDPEHTLNYNIRVLGRRGVLVMNAIAGMDQLAEIGPEMEALMASTSFKEGNRYADFDEKADKVAAYGIGALVAGGVAAKTGLLKGLLAMLLAGKKFVIVAVVGAFAALRGLFFGQKSQDG